MALLDLSLVTQTIQKLVEVYVNASPAWPSGINAEVSPRPPEKLAGNYTIGLYLYHVSENGHYKNLPNPDNSTLPVRYTPMGLNLYYHLCAHSDLDSVTGTHREQLLMGLAIKALRDYPVIDDTTELKDRSGTNTPILNHQLKGANNRFRLTLEATAPNEAVSYWAPGTKSNRLSAFYQASVVLLEPERPDSRAGRVLTYGVHTFLDLPPRLTGSRNVITIDPPKLAQPMEIEFRPAQVSTGERITFEGSGLQVDSTEIWLSYQDWSESVKLDHAVWKLQLEENGVSVEIQEKAGSRDILPGFYTAFVKVIQERKMPDGSSRKFEHTSNKTPFTITPKIEIDDPPAAVPRIFTVESFLFQKILDGDIKPDSLKVFIGGEALSEGVGPSPAKGEYIIRADAKLKFRIQDDPGKIGLDSEEFVSFRLVINGAESPPKWIKWIKEGP